MKKNYLLLLLLAIFLPACQDDDNNEISKVEVSEDEWYSGGRLGTVFNATSFAYEQPTAVVEANSAMSQAFKFGEYFFENDYNENTDGAFCGLGPLMVRRGCFYCHPNYGHGSRQTE